MNSADLDRLADTLGFGFTILALSVLLITVLSAPQFFIVLGAVLFALIGLIVFSFVCCVFFIFLNDVKKSHARIRGAKNP